MAPKTLANDKNAHETFRMHLGKNKQTNKKQKNKKTKKKSFQYFT